MDTYIKDLVSVITPVYKAERHLAETIESVQNQTYSHWEHLLIDDASPDQSVSLIEAYQKDDARIQLIRLAENQGAAVARNKGLDEARGQFIAFIDSDDVWAPDKLDYQIAFMKQHGYAFTYTDLALMDETGEIQKAQVGVPDALTYHDLLKNTAIACSTVVIDRAQVGDFQMPLVRKGQDTATWLMLMREQKLTAYGLDEVLNYYRQVPGSISSNRWGALKRTWHTYRQIEKLSLPQASYYFTNYVFNAIRRRL